MEVIHMATNSTTHYHLSQWLGTDSFRRDDLNNDNLKIENALSAHDALLAAVPMELVAHNKLTAANRTLELDLCDITLSDYLCLTLVIDAKFGTVDDSNMYLRLNSVSTFSYYRNGNATGLGYLMKTPTSTQYQRSRVVRFFPYESGAYVSCEYVSDNGEDIGHNIVTAKDVRWADLDTITYSAGSISSSMVAGSGLYLFGIKKP